MKGQGARCVRCGSQRGAAWGTRAAEEGTTGAAGGPGQPGEQSKPVALAHLEGGAGNLVNDLPSPLSSLCSLTSNGEESL